MQTYFADLLAFFGISGAPQTFAELIPWMFGVLVALGIVLACFRLISECIKRWAVVFVDLHFLSLPSCFLAFGCFPAFAAL